MKLSDRANAIHGSATVELNARVLALKKSGVDIIKFNIGEPDFNTPENICDAGKRAMDEGKTRYTDGSGIEELKEAICQKLSKENDLHYTPAEISVTTGVAQGMFVALLSTLNPGDEVLVPDPVYPVYVDSNIMAGRKIVYAAATAENGFLPLPDEETDADIIYLCSPNNPTGAVYDKDGLKAWVDYAKKQNAIILFDSAYEFYVTDKSLPRSVYEVEGADEVAIEFCSLSKTAGFTGTRCGYTIIPKKLGALNRMWLRRQSTKYNGVPYIVQRMAEAVFSDEGQAQIAANVGVYMKNARLISDTLSELGIWPTGGVNSPYIWFKVPGGDSWAFFDRRLSEANIVGTPGAGFGKNGEGFLRLTAFNNYENTAEAMKRIKNMLTK